MGLKVFVFKHFNYHQKLKLFPVIFIFSLLIVYLLAIKDTFNLISACNKLETEIRTADKAPHEIEQLYEKLSSINLITGEKAQIIGLDPFLEFCSNYEKKDDINLIDYKPLHSFQKSNFQIDTRIATFEGNFNNLLRFLFSIEKDFKSGIIVSVKFYVEVNNKTNKKNLYLTLFIQTIKDYDNSKSDV
jgi:hypothetical protein